MKSKPRIANQAIFLSRSAYSLRRAAEQVAGISEWVVFIQSKGLRWTRSHEPMPEVPAHLYSKEHPLHDRREYDASSFDQELARLQDEVLALGSMVEEALVQSVETLKKRDFTGSRSSSPETGSLTNGATH